MRNNHLIRLTIALLITVVIGNIAYSVITANNRKYFHAIRKNEFMFKQDTTAYDVVMLGASRMKNTLNPRIFDSITGLNSYNAGASAARIYEQKMILDAYLLQHKAPKYLLMTLDLVTLETDKYIKLYPDYLTCIDVPAVNELLDKEKIHTTLYQYLPFLVTVEMNDYYKGSIIRNLKHQKDIHEGDFMYKGYVSNTTDTLGRDTLGREAMGQHSDKSIGLLQQLVNTAKQHNIKVVFTYAPEYKDLNIKSVPNADEMLAIYTQFAAKNGIPFHRHDSLPMCLERRYFANNGHVNKIGADVYSRIYAQMFIEGKLTQRGKSQ
jgi:hypothetical protein